MQAALADREAGARRAVAVALVTGDARGAREARSGFDALHAAVVDARRPPARAVVVTEVQPDRPAALLAAAGRGGSILTAGNVLVLAGEGGVAKSPSGADAPRFAWPTGWARSTSNDPGARLDGTGYGALHGGLFDGAGGQALVVTYEDTAADVAFRLRTLAGWWWGETDPDRATAALRNVRVLADPGPLFGPVAAFGGEGSALYTARPGPLDGWPDLWTAADECPDLRLIVIDPAMAAFAGDQNAAAGVREFYAALRREARARLLGVLLVAHTNKTSRGSVSDIYDPGSTAGSTHWTDAARGACRLGWPEDDNYDGGRAADRLQGQLWPAKAAYRRQAGAGAQRRDMRFHGRRRLADARRSREGRGRGEARRRGGRRRQARGRRRRGPDRARGAGRTVTAAELAAERLAARTADEILDAEARIAWAKMPEHHGAECPPDRVPATLALAAWLPECPAKRRAAAAAGMDRVALALMAAAPLHTPLGEALGWPRSLRPHPGGSFAQHAAAPTMQARAMATFARRWLLTDPAEAGWFTPTVTPDWVAEGWERHWRPADRHPAAGRRAPARTVAAGP